MSSVAGGGVLPARGTHPSEATAISGVALDVPGRVRRKLASPPARSSCIQSDRRLVTLPPEFDRGSNRFSCGELSFVRSSSKGCWALLIPA